MTLSPRQRANEEQRRAADPAASAFVEASAGSGKTKLLTDRLLRLMLTPVGSGWIAPQRIQCLTFTKAAAAEMSVRLQNTLGTWVTLDDAALDARLTDLDLTPIDTLRKKARALFADVLDLPGGMRIGTIHAFCQSLLRRFPLEAALSPHFRLMDDPDAADALTEAREDMLARASSAPMRQALALLAGLASAQQFGHHVVALQTDRARLQHALALGTDLAAAQRRALGVTAASDAEILAHAVNWPSEPRLRRAAEFVLANGSPSVAARAERILGWLSLDAQTRTEFWDSWREEFHTKAGQARAAGAFVNANLSKAQPTLSEPYLDEAARIDAVEDNRRALSVAVISHALVTLADPMLRAYADRKANAGLLDYDDLIGHASQLLIDPGAAWVLYKLDGGIDHLLLDEVQDTAPSQWRIAHALTEEFFAGMGARDTHRTVFAVGDKKQSIYSFQGADVEAFDKARALWQRRVVGADKEFRDVPLDVSFRSTEPVLRLVDAVFADPIAAAGVAAPGALRHYADRVGEPGAVELWPLAPPPDEPDPEPWTVPDRNQGQLSAPQRLADRLAEWIAQETNGRVPLESKGRPLRAGDVMVLVRRRNEFARALVRALKSRGVAVAGLDRLELTAQPAVQDLMALADALLLPQDDLAFACMLTSPLGGLTDDSLMQLAIGRGGKLWEALRDRADEQTDWRAARDFFVTLLARVDYLSPHAVLSHALGPLGGRARLFARLGAEAADPIDELLQAALTYARGHPPSLQGLLHWLRRSVPEVKREQEVAADAVRIMTVHGAKGLQAPLVILPDTTALPPEEGGLLWADDPMTQQTVPIFAPRRELRCATAQLLRDDAATRRMEEHNRLLYVALTRAEDRLVVCGWQTRRTMADTCWYRLVERGFERLPTEEAAFGDWGMVRRHAQQGPARATAAPATLVAAPPLPPWAGSAPDWRPLPPPAEPARPERLAPSRPEGAELGPVPAAASPLAAHGATDRFHRGQVLHALLQHLPELPPDARPAAARTWLHRPGQGLSSAEATALADEVLAILDHPDLAPAFGPTSRAEVPLIGVIGNAVIGGLVDRLAVLPDQVLIADYKTNRRPPATDAATPVLYLRQLAAYRAVLRQLFPGRAVRCALVWTQAARVSMLSDAMLDSHAPA
ncbi:MAG TPA: double-strand break repair helicase AddA [Acetobacteraceae bacterium]|jgi:ATP-dependent helicase/nuclease subunit A|nr:double-strand break repair helicase AddA [Acetobacteraceae bacterium]